MVKKLSTSDPYSSLCNDLYSIGIFDQTINGLLDVVEKNDKNCTLLIKRKFANNSGNYVGAGYYFIQCLNTQCEEEHLKQFRSLLEFFVKEKTKGNYMEVDAIIIAPSYTKEVLNFIDHYNSIQRRKPIQLFTYEV